MSLILKVAQEDDRVRAVLLSGSRTNTKVKPDAFQDYDVVYLVRDIAAFLANANWIDVFGERMILQLPDLMSLSGSDKRIIDERQTFSYLMQFADRNRIDLTLCLLAQRSLCEDSLTQVILDKDGLYPHPLQASDEDYITKLPAEQQFLDCCNEFWWVSTYVIKGLCRGEILYAKAMLEGPVRKMFMRLLDWQVGRQHDFKVNTGYCGKFLQAFVSKELWQRILITYPNAESEQIWRSLGEMMQLFFEWEIALAQELSFKVNIEEAENVRQYYVSARTEFNK